MSVLNPFVAVTAVTPNRGIDAEFVDLPGEDLADVALSAAIAAGASYADLRIHRITTEIMQLRGGELETAVPSRELGLVVPHRRQDRRAGRLLQSAMPSLRIPDFYLSSISQAQ